MSKRIAFHFYSLAQGGVERMRLALARELIARGYSVDFVLCQAVGELLPLAPPEVRIIDLGGKRTITSVPALVRYFRESPPDAMFSSMGHQNVAAIVARRIARSSVWLGVLQHNALKEESESGLSLQHRILPLLYRLTLRGADRVFAVSQGVADDMAEMTGYPRERIGVLYNPACPDEDESAAPPPVDHAFFGQGAPVIFGAGRLVAQKGWDTLLHAMAIVVAQRPARLVIAGVGPDEAMLKNLISTLGIEDSVALVGYQPKPIAWMAAADLLVMSSRYEGFGNVLVEAMSVGTPVVSTDCHYGPAEILADGDFGQLVPVGDAEAMAAAILRALAAPADPERLVTRAREFSLPRATDHYLEAAFG